MKTLKLCFCAVGTLLASLFLNAEEIIFDPMLTGWTKITSKNFFSDKEIKISKQCSVRLVNGGMIRKSFAVDPNSKYELTWYVKGKEIESGNKRGASILLNSGKKWTLAVANPEGKPETGTFDWRKGRKIIDTSIYNSGEIRIYLRIGGQGTVWYDGLKLEKINIPGNKTNEGKNISYSVKLFPQMFAAAFTKNPTIIDITSLYLRCSIPAFIPTCSGVRESFSARVIPYSLTATVSTTTPSSWGASAAPESPAAAIIANAVTPAPGIFSSIIISVPGQSIAVQKPVTAQAISETTAFWEKVTVR